MTQAKYKRKISEIFSDIKCQLENVSQITCFKFSQLRFLYCVTNVTSNVTILLMNWEGRVKKRSWYILKYHRALAQNLSEAIKYSKITGLRDINPIKDRRSL
jgi:hypothetical protein